MPRFKCMKTFISGFSSIMGFGLILLSGALWAAEATVRSDSPGTYRVVDGDTLWDIAGKFLEQPWLWPQVWQINPQIRNPDLIYPGDVIELAYENGVPVLRLGNTGDSGPAYTGGLPTVKLSPEIRREPILSPIPAIPLEKISSFLSSNFIVAASEIATAPYVLGEREGRQLASNGDEIMARGNWPSDIITYDVVRSGRDLIDPDSKSSVGREAVFIGVATISSTNGSEAFLTVGELVQEIRKGDFLLPREDTQLDSRFMPRAPGFVVDAAIVSIGSGRALGGTYDTLILNKGESAGLEAGQILTVQEADTVITDTVGKASPWSKLKQVVGLDSSNSVKFPGKTVATVLVYKVFDGSSLALVLESNKPIKVQDRVISPL